MYNVTSDRRRKRNYKQFIFFINKYNRQDIINNNHFLSDNYISNIETSFKLYYFIKSLQSNYILHALKKEAETNGGEHENLKYYTTKIFNQTLLKFKLFYNNNKSFIDNNLNEIKKQFVTILNMI